jgi:hypothetical protein
MRSRNVNRAAPPQRDPANELYDRACDIVAVAAELRDASRHDDNDAAVAATLNCLETALRDVASALDALSASGVRRIASAWPALGERAAFDADEARSAFDAATEAVRAAGDACGDVRRAVGPLLAELSPV